MQQGKPYVGTGRYLHEDGTIVYWDVHTTAVRVGDRLLGHVGMVVDITDRKRAEEEVRRREQQYASLINTVEGIVWEADPATLCFSFVSQQAERILGYPARQWLSEPHFWTDRLHQDDREACVGYCMEETKQGRSHDFEYRMIAADGRVVWLRDLVSVTVEEGRPVKLRGIMVDITDRKEAEEALRASEERFRAIFESTALGVVVGCHPTGTGIDQVNPAFQSMTGYNLEELCRLGMTGLTYPDDLPASKALVERLVSGALTYDSIEKRYVKKDGSIMWAQTTVSRIRDEQGNYEKSVAMIQDITERKRAEEALRRSERQLRTVLDALPVGVWFTDQSGKPVLSNPAAKQIWSGIKQVGIEKSANAAGWWEEIGPSSELHRWALSHALTKGIPSLNETLDLECLDGTRKTIRNTTVPVQDEAGVILGAIVLNEDITTLRQAQAALQLTQFSVDHAVEGFFWIGPDARIFHVNDAACRMLEYTREELTTMTIHDIDPNFPPEVWHPHWEELKEKGSLTFESKHWSRTGRVLDTEVTVNYLQYEGKEYNCAIMRDIGERKRAEEALSRSDGRFKTMFAQAPIGIALIDSLTGQIHEVNDAYAQIVGRTTEEMRSLDWMSITHPDDVQADLDNMARLRTGDITGFQMEKRYVRHDGTVAWINLTVVPIQVEEQAGPHHFAMIQDITERKQTEEALRQSEERLRSFMMNSPSLVFFKTLDGRYLYVNPAFERLFQLPEGHIIGKTDYEVFSREQANQFAVNDRRVLHEGHALETEETASYEDGTHTSLAMKFPVFGADGAVWGIGGIVTDITSRKQTEAALRASEERYRVLYDETPTMYFTLAMDGTVRAVNRFGAEQLGYQVEELIGYSVLGLFHEQDKETVAANLSECLATPETTRHWEFRKIRKDGGIIWVRETARVGQSSTGETVVLVTCEDITERRANEQLLASEKRILEMIATDVPLQEVLTLMCQVFEGLSSGGHCSILLLDPDGLHLRHGAAPSLPEAYVHAIDGLAIGPTVGSCGTAAFMRRQVIVLDIASDPLWTDFRDLALRHGFRACWSAPIIASNDTVLGTFAVYYGEPQQPTHADLRLIERAAHIACIAIERKQAEETVREKQLQLTEAQRLAKVGSWYWIVETDTVTWSDELYAIFGRDPNQPAVSYKDHPKIYTVDSYARLDKAVTQALATGERYELELEFIHADGTHRWGVARGEPIQGNDGCVIQLHGTFQDITERKGAEDVQKRLLTELAESQKHFEHIFHWTPSAVAISTLVEGRLLDVNDRLVQLTGYSREELIGHTTAELQLWADPSERAHVIQEILQQRSLHNKEGLLRTKSGDIRAIMVSVDQIQVNATPCLIYVAHDITERKRMEEALRQRERDLRAAVEERERISQDLHDGILQSLFAVGLTLETTKSMMSPRTRKTSGAPLNQAIEQLNRVMREVRNFIAGLGSNLLQGKDLPTALQHMLKSLTQHHATRVRLAVEDRAAQAVSAEQSLHLFHVIQEAVSNCIRHGRAQEARVSLKMLKQGVRLSIRDNGSGFNPDAAKVAGHGLSNMAARAQKIGGRFTVLSKVNGGTRIVLDLPKEASDVRR